MGGLGIFSNHDCHSRSLSIWDMSSVESREGNGEKGSGLLRQGGTGPFSVRQFGHPVRVLPVATCTDDELGREMLEG